MRKPLTAAQKAERLADYETAQLLRAVDAVDAMRAHLEGEGHAPPEIRTDLLKLHGLATRVVGQAKPDPASVRELFEMTGEIEYRIDELTEALDELRGIMDALVVLEPDDLDD